jgi:hypothetical protein
VLDAIGGGCRFVIRSDIAKFFTRIPKSVVTKIVNEPVVDTDFAVSVSSASIRACWF